MNKIFLLVILSSLLFASCRKDRGQKITDFYNATVLGRGLDCGNAYMIKFDKAVSGLSEDPMNIYYEINLPDKYKIGEKRIKAAFREPNKDEIMLCTGMGPSYPQIFIIKAEGLSDLSNELD